MRALIHLILVFSSAFSGVSVESVSRAFESRYQHATTLRAFFFQSYSDGKGSISADSGTVYFSKPGRMRWEYESPEKKLFLVDGTNVWFYVPADNTVSRAKLSESSDWRTPLALLAGKTDLSKLCRSIESTPGAKPTGPSVSADTGVRCIPRESPESETIHDVLFELAPSGYLNRLVINEAGNASTEFRFGNWEENIAIPEVKFHFDPPKGVAVVDEQTLAGTIR